jgi:indole-3-glycerol phosphate synthase
MIPLGAYPEATPASSEESRSILLMDVGTHSGSILSCIVEKRRETIAHRQRVLPLAVLKMTVVNKKVSPPRDFAGALGHSGTINIIAELKKASPSRGVIREDYEPAEIASVLAGAGAAALSVLTEEDFFQGSLAHLKEARKQVKIPILRKDFIVDPWQVWEARAVEADSFLLITAILDDRTLGELLALGRDLGMEALVEVHTREELHRAVSSGARILGVNNRDLKTFKVCLDTSLALVDDIPAECVAVSESGIRSREDIERLRHAGFDAFLIGEHLMDSPDPAAALRRMIGAA